MPVDTGNNCSSQWQKWKEKGPYKMPKFDLNEDIVISGFSGRYAESENVEELKKNLFGGIDMITENDRRWKTGLSGIPQRMGKLKDVDKFDYLFFGVHGKQADALDPMHRILLETTYEALFDAGYEPSTLRDKRVGVFVGCSDRSFAGSAVPEDLITGYELLGVSAAMLANRVSFTFGFTGPSMTVDTACSSTMHALNEAYLALKNNRCDAAIVGGATITLSAASVVPFTKLGLLSKNGTCRVFDDNANGYVKSEAVGSIFLQRASEAKRCYATILHCKLNNDGAKQEGISFPSAALQTQLLTEIFSELDINPVDINYVEAHGTGTVAGDREESNVIGDFFCKGRESPLLVGSVKSNLGHAEAASGTCTIAKIILSMEEEAIPPNLHYREPNHQVPALVDGKMKVVTESTPWTPSIVAANNFGFGGSNACVILKPNLKERTDRPKREIPRLVLVSGRSEDAVKHIFSKIEENHFTDEALVLLEEACKAPTQGMCYRGHTLLQDDDDKPTLTIEKASSQHRPVWFLFSGMGSQWPQMAKDMMRLNSFANSINTSAEILKPFGIDLIHLLTEATEQELNHIVAPFVTIAAVQIALVDVVKSLGIKPEGIVGHSVGELGCAYADGCFSAKQMILAAYWRGKSCAQTDLIHGAMAAVGMTWEEAKSSCPQGVYPVCHNAEDSVTISGPAHKVKEFIKELTSKKIFAREVNTCDIAFHSRYVEPAAHIMKKELMKVIPNPLPRSARWVSSSVPESEWAEPHAQLSSVDYHVNNLLSPVLFNEAMSKVPKNAIIIEFAPHCLLQPIVKRILGRDAVYVGLMKKHRQDNLVYFLEAIGKMFISNLNPAAKNLYEPVTFPVPRGTPMLNSLIKWDHSVSLIAWSDELDKKYKDIVLYDTLKHGPNEYLLGHKVDGRILFPFMGYVFIAWKALAKSLQMNYYDVSPIIEDFRVFRATMIPKTGIYTFGVKLLECDGTFRIMESGSIVASGRIRQGDQSVLETVGRDFSISNKGFEQQNFTLDASDFYKELRLRGYEYGPTFQGVLKANANGLTGTIKWNENWVTFMDAMLQIPILCIPLRILLLPTRVKSIRIDVSKKPKEKEDILLEFNHHKNICRAGPVEIKGLYCAVAPKKRDHISEPILEEQIFVPLNDLFIFNTEETKVLEEYSSVCSTLTHRILLRKENSKPEISEILNGYNKAPEALIDLLLKKEEKSHVLLKILKEILDLDNDSLKDKLDEVISKNEFEIQNDFFCIQILKERSLRAALDVVIENCFSSRLKILEISGNAIIQKDVLKMMNLTSLGLTKYDYTVARICNKPIPDGFLPAGVELITTDIKNNDIPKGNDLVVAKDILTDSVCDEQSLLQAVTDAMKPNGFFLLIERTRVYPAEKLISFFTKNKLQVQKESRLELAFKKLGLTVLSKKSDQMTSVMYLLRKLEKIQENLIQPVLIQVSDCNQYLWVDELGEAMKTNAEENLKRNIWLYSSDVNSGIVGLINCLKQEPGGENVRCILDCQGPGHKVISNVKDFLIKFKDIILKDLVLNVLKDKQWGMFRHRLIEKAPQTLLRRKAFGNATKRGDLSSFVWIENSPSLPKNVENVVNVEIYYSSLNFRDVMLASGKLPIDNTQGKVALEECVLGFEFVGRDPEGRRVMGIATSKALATSIYIQRDWLIEMPEQWSMEEASTIPIVYMTSYYALFTRGNMKPGESILIHSGTGGVGQAAISISLSIGCTVYTTVGSEEKRTILKSLFPELSDENIFSSRDVNFQDQVMSATEGKGVDLVLNSLSEDKLQASLKCLRRNGRFLEIGKFDILMNNSIGMEVLNNNVTLHSVQLDSIIIENDKGILDDLKKQVVEGVRNGAVRPLKANVFNYDEAESAFRFLASGQHIGKVVLKIREEEPEKIILPTPIEIICIPRTYCHSHMSYIVTGGLGGFGFELASWLVERGARNIVLSSRTCVKNQYQRLCIQRWKNEGTEVIVSNQDISSPSGCKTLLQEAKNLGPVGGIFHLAMVLRDGLFENLTSQDFQEVCRSKVTGVQQLDRLSRELCPKLEYFVVFSSISCGRGNPGQSNYGYANSVMERVVEQRKQQGFPGLAIQWGGIGDVGVVYEKMGGNEVILKGTVPQRLNSCLALMDKFMQEDATVVSSFVPVEKAAFGGGSREDMISTLCRVLGVKDPSTVKPETTLGELGMDSLMGVEIKQVLETDYDTTLSVPEVRQLSMKDLQEIEKRKQLSISTSEPTTTIKTMEGTQVYVNEMYIPDEILVPLNESEDKRCVFFVHPIEGHVRMLKSLAQNIKCKAYGLQFTEDVPCDSIEDIAACYVEQIKRVQPVGPYRLVGYSFGTLVALEMALLLQRNEKVKSFLCIDGSPKETEELSRINVKDSNDSTNFEHKGIFLKLFARTYFRNLPKQIEFLQILEGENSSAIQSVLSPYMGDFDLGTAEKLGERLYTLYTAAKKYTPKKTYQGRATLVKATLGKRQDYLQATKENDYCLNENVNGSVEVLTIKCEQYVIVEDSSNEVSKIINDRI